MELQYSLNKPNKFTQVENPLVVGQDVPIDASFGVSKSADQSGISVLLKEGHYTIWRWVNTTESWESLGEINNKSSISLGWVEDVTKYYFQTMTLAFDAAEIRVTGLSGNLLIDSDPSDGLDQGGASLLAFSGQINQGNIGTIGGSGQKGDKGESGIVQSGQFSWDGQTTGFVPQAGEFAWSGEPAYLGITSLTFHKEDEDGTDQSIFLDQYLNTKSGQIKTILNANPQHINVFQIIGANIDSNGNYKFDVYNVSYGDIGVTSGDCAVYFVLVGQEGDKGEAGQDGVIGVDGAKGEKGEAGLDGTAANQGQKGDKGESSDMGGTMTASIIPDTNEQYDLGNAEYKIRHLFLSDNSMYIGDTWIKAEGNQIKTPNLLVGDINLNNEGRQNEVDGTSGHWSIQEGSDDLFLINRNTGKKYKFNLTEM
jgi:hypothetical protein